MSVRGGGLAVVSLGLSCQTSHQLRRQLPLLQPDYVIDAMYFDYVITPFETLLAILAGAFPALSLPAQITPLLGHAWWKAQGMFFPHDFRAGLMGGALDIEANFARSAARLGHLREKFLALDQAAERLVFVLGNGQADLGFFAGSAARRQVLFGFTRARIAACRDVLARRYGSRFVRLVVVESAESASGDWRLDQVSRHDAGLRTGAPDRLWEGDDAFWAGLLAAEIAADDPACMRPDAALLAVVIQAVAAEFMVEPAMLSARTTAMDVPGWDSISHTMLVMRLEDALGCVLDAGRLQGAADLGALADAIGAAGRDAG